MSLLELKTNKNNKDFLQRMSYLYDRKSSSSMADHFIQKQKKYNQKNNPIKKHLDQFQSSWQRVQKQVKFIVNEFSQKMKKLVQNINDCTKYYKILNMLRKNQFLSDISQNINKTLIDQLKNSQQKIQSLQLLNSMKQTNINLNKKIDLNKNNNFQNENASFSPQFQKENQNKRMLDYKINQDSEKRQKIKPVLNSCISLSQNIYNHSKILPQEQFLQWCEKIMMEGKIVIKQKNNPNQSNFKYPFDQSKNIDLFNKTQPLSQQNKRHLRSRSEVVNHSLWSKSQTNQQEKRQLVDRIQEKINKIIENVSRTDLNQQNSQFNIETQKLSISNYLSRILQKKFSCKQLCCTIKGRFQNSLKQTRYLSEQQKIKMKEPQNTYLNGQNKMVKISKQKDVYRDSKTEEYFKRYYKRKDFNINQIKSVQQTKAQEMNRLESQYIKMSQMRRKQRYGY